MTSTVSPEAYVFPDRLGEEELKSLTNEHISQALEAMQFPSKMCETIRGDPEANGRALYELVTSSGNDKVIDFGVFGLNVPQSVYDENSRRSTFRQSVSMSTDVHLALRLMRDMNKKIGINPQRDERITSVVAESVHVMVRPKQWDAFLTFKFMRDALGVIIVVNVMIFMSWEYFFDNFHTSAGEVVFAPTLYDAAANVYQDIFALWSLFMSLYIAVFRMPFGGSDLARQPVSRIYWFSAMPLFASVILSLFNVGLQRAGYAAISESIQTLLFLFGMPIFMCGLFLASRTIANRSKGAMMHLKSNIFASCFSLLLFAVIFCRTYYGWVSTTYSMDRISK